MYAIEAPNVQESRGGLLQVADVIDSADKHVFFQGVTYQGHLCGHSDRVPTDGSEKQFDQLPLIEGAPFAIYRGVDVSMFQRNEAVTVARDAFGAGESYAVERAVQELVLNPQAEDITPTAGTPVTNGKYAAGLLEQYAAENYGGLPLLHADRATTTLFAPDQDADGWKLHTNQGTPIANGGGYSRTGPGGTVAPDGAGWVYISGQVHIWRGELNVVSGYELAANRNLGLAEATYVPTVDCFVAAILVGI